MTSGQGDQLAVLMAEVMNLAGLVRRGDDAAWSGIGPDAHLRFANELLKFSSLAADEDELAAPFSLADASVSARSLAEELMRCGIPVSGDAQRLASALLSSMGVGTDVLEALDGEL